MRGGGRVEGVRERVREWLSKSERGREGEGVVREGVVKKGKRWRGCASEDQSGGEEISYVRGVRWSEGVRE